MKSALAAFFVLACPIAVSAEAGAAEKSPRELCIERSAREMKAMMDRSNFLAQAERQKREGLAGYDPHDQVLARLPAHYSSRLKPSCEMLSDSVLKVSTGSAPRFSATRGGAAWKSSKKMRTGKPD